MNNLEVAINAAKIGAENALQYFNSNLKIELKEDLSPVTVADKETEKLVEEYISSQIPDAKFVGEEFGGDYSQSDYWLIDPIDGTAFFARGMLFWGTLITHVTNGQANIGVSYMPLFNELLYAEEGKGAFLNDQQIHVSDKSSVNEAFIIHNSIHKIVDKANGMMTLGKMAHKFKGIGDSYGYHLLANGRVDAKFDGDVLPFDVAGLNLIIEEAGGKVTNFSGSPWTFDRRDVLATNGLVHDEIVKIIQQ